jgi:hypothetical protein
MIQGMVYGAAIVVAVVGAVLYAGLRRHAYVVVRRGSRGSAQVR